MGLARCGDGLGGVVCHREQDAAVGGGLDGSDGLGVDGGFAGRDLRGELACHVRGLLRGHDDSGSKGGAAGDLRDNGLGGQGLAS